MCVDYAANAGEEAILLALEPIVTALNSRITRIRRMMNPVRPASNTPAAIAAAARRHGDSGTTLFISLSGWSQAYAAETIMLEAVVDHRLDRDAVAADAMAQFRSVLDDQRRLKEEAEALGLDEPIQRHMFRRIDHLRIEAHAFDALVGRMGPRKALEWLGEQMELLHLSNHHHPPDHKSCVETHRGFVWPLLSLPDLDPRPADPGRTEPLWMGRRVSLAADLPASMLTALPGHPLDRMLHGTPIGNRIIQEATVVPVKTDESDDPVSTLLLTLAPVDEVGVAALLAWEADLTPDE